MTVNFIRHGKTEGNLTKRYIGRTDEPLCETGISELKGIAYPECEIVIASPMKRCLQTASLIYPEMHPIVYDDLRECDFGDFEGKNHAELEGDPVYDAWLEKGGMAAFPNGEDSSEFCARCAECVLRALRENAAANSVSFVVHGGTIMSALERLAEPHKEFYEYMTENGHGYVTEFDGERIVITHRI